MTSNVIIALNAQCISYFLRIDEAMSLFFYMNLKFFKYVE